MKSIAFKKYLACVLVGFGACVIPMNMPAAAPTDECSKELLLSYFPEVFVNETLGKFKVPQDKWAAINTDLSSKDKEVIKMVESKASQMNPNPLKDPQQRQAAVKIFRETLYQVFADSMRANGITDEQQIQGMLDDIQQQKAKRFAMCMQKQKEQAPSENAAPQQATPQKSSSKSHDDSGNN